jgi:hypothetical protein
MTKTKAIPDGMHTVTPHLICAGAADAIEFYKKAFNATETSRLPGPNGRLMHASLKIGDSTVMLVDEMPEHGALGPKSPQGFAGRHPSLCRGCRRVRNAGRSCRCEGYDAGHRHVFGAIATVKSRTRSATAGRLPRMFATSVRPLCKRPCRACAASRQPSSMLE